MPLAAVLPMAGSVVPPGFLECNGQAVSRTTYADLFTAIGTTYGPGDSATTFNVPDMRDQFIRGKSDARAVGSTQAGSFGIPHPRRQRPDTRTYCITASAQPLGNDRRPHPWGERSWPLALDSCLQSLGTVRQWRSAATPAGNRVWADHWRRRHWDWHPSSSPYWLNE